MSIAAPLPTVSRATLVTASKGIPLKVFKEEALLAATNFLLGKDANGRDVTFAPAIFENSPLNINAEAYDPITTYPVPVDPCVKDLSKPPAEHGTHEDRQYALAHRRNVSFALLCNEVRQDVRALIDLSLTTNTSRVDTLTPFLDLKAKLNNDLVDIGESMERMARNGKATRAEITAHNGSLTNKIDSDELFQTHEVADKGRFNAIVSLRDRAPEVVAALDAVFAKFKVGEHAPARQPAPAFGEAQSNHVVP